jgi:FixJ family two-component response regulator
MSKTNRLILIDSDSRRRAAVSHCLAESPIHVEPFESLDEIGSRWPRDGVLLVLDEGDTVNRVMQAMAASGNWLPLVAYAEAPDTRRAVKAVLAGAIDYIAWPFDAETIGEVLGEAGQRAETLGSARLREAMARSRIERLTRREREVLAGVADGLSNRLIGEKLRISPRTVEIHRANMLNKMGANHTSEAIRIAIEASLIN